MFVSHLFALLVAGVVHEAGHALSAVRYSYLFLFDVYSSELCSFIPSEGGSINFVGMFVMFVYPGAFVDLNSSLLLLSAQSRLFPFIAALFFLFLSPLVSDGRV